MKRKTIGILATSVAVSALCLVTDVSSMAKGGGGGGGGHPHGGGGGGHGLAIHGGAAHVGHGLSFGHLLSAHGFSAHALHTRGLTGHAITSHGVRSGYHYAGHNLSHGHAITGNAGRFASHGLTNAGRNALNHNQLGGHEAVRNQFAHNGPLDLNQVTHNQFATQNFHGLNNFSKTGFNRNVFGNNANWNHWGRHFWGAGWDNWGGGWGGWAGPVFWPFVLGDVLSFVLWPYAYYDPFWVYGPPFIFASIFAPGPYFGLDYGYGPDYYEYAGSPNIYYNYNYAGGRYYNYAGGGRRIATTDQSDRQALAEVNNEAVQSCAGLAPGVTNLPIDRIRQTVHPTADQEAALDDLSSALSRASDIIQSSCPTTVPLTPIGRLDVAEQRLNGTIKAIEVIRAPLERFYDSLSDQQKQQLNAMNDSTAEAGQTASNQVALCNQQGGSLVNLPVQRIEEVVQPSPEQQRAFDDLKKATQQAADQLQSSCPTAVPQSPLARLDTVETRLKATADAIQSVRPALENFYASLNDEQKARFNMMGPPARAASSRPQPQSGGR